MIVPSLEIRPYVPGDLTAVARLWYDAWHEDHPGERHADPMAKWQDVWERRAVPCAQVWVATRDGAHAGHAALFGVRTEHTHVIIAPEHRRQGIGAELVRRFKRASPSGVRLVVDWDNAAARAFYAAQGFVPGAASIHRRTGRPQLEYLWCDHEGATHR